MSVDVGERELGAGVGSFAADDDSGPGRPVVQVEQVGEFGDPGAAAGLPVGVVGLSPGVFRGGQDRLLQVLVDREARARIRSRAARSAAANTWVAPAESALAITLGPSGCIRAGAVPAGG